MADHLAECQDCQDADFLLQALPGTRLGKRERWALQHAGALCATARPMFFEPETYIREAKPTATTEAH